MSKVSRIENPELYALRDRLSNAGITDQAANVVASELDGLRKQFVFLLGKLEALENATPPHLRKVERR